RGAGPALDLPRRVAHTHATQYIPTCFGAMDRAQFPSEARATAVKEFFDCRSPLRPVARVERRPRAEIRPVREFSSRRKTRHLEQLRRNIDLVIHHVPVPEAGLGGEHGALVALLRFTQRLFGAFPCGDVGRRAGPAQDLPACVAHTPAPKKLPARFTPMDG